MQQVFVLLFEYIMGLKMVDITTLEYGILAGYGFSIFFVIFGFKFSLLYEY